MKNSRLLGALAALQRRGYPLIVQAHDFAEDFRPEVYDASSPYPEDCDYIAINTRDRDRLIAAGLDPGQVHFIPNPIAPATSFEPRSDFQAECSRGRDLVLYPVRAIRRKNIGEAILLSRFLPRGAELAVTLPPTSPSDLPVYSRWKDFAITEACPIRFEAGLNASLEELYAKAARVVTTSVKEGYGFSFVDPLARGIPVTGREVPYVVRDFMELGLTFPSLYGSIDVPRLALPAAALETSVSRLIRKFRAAFSPAFRSSSQEPLEYCLSRLPGRFTGDLVDFGALDEDLQTEVLARLLVDSGLDAQIRAINPALESLFGAAPSEDAALAQRDIIAERLSEGRNVSSLVAAYRAALEARPRGSIDKRILLASYLKPESFFMVAS
jgi:hypothetical protein